MGARPGRPEMDELILRYLSGDATDVEARRVEKWRDAAPENGARVRELTSLWTGLGRARSPSRRPHPPVEVLLEEAERRREASRTKAARRALLRSPWAGYGLAAAAVMALAFVGLEAWRDGFRRHGLSAVASSVGEGEVVAMTLSDGSYVRLARGASLSFPASGGGREVVLGGKAFFAVSHSGEPFSVRTENGDVTVLGTRFQVRSDGEGLEVVVVDGEVEVAAPGGTARALANQVATVQDGRVPLVTTVADVWSRMDWPGGLLVFQGTPLAAVAAELGRFYGVSVRVEDATASALGITGSFQGEPLQAVVEAVCAVTGIRCEATADSVILGAPRR